MTHPPRNSSPPPESDQPTPRHFPTDDVRAKAIHALWLSALCICTALAEPLPTLDVEPTMDDQRRLEYEFEQPLTGRKEPQLLAATESKILDLARKQFAERPRSDVICLGIGHPVPILQQRCCSW